MNLFINNTRRTLTIEYFLGKCYPIAGQGLQPPPAVLFLFLLYNGEYIMARKKIEKLPEGTSYLELWENEFKPEILSYYGEVPIEVVSKALGISVARVQEQLRSGQYDYGVARKCSGDTYRYEFMSLRLIAYVEGSMNIKKIINYGEVD
jgi:hypothetical protein